MKKTVPFTLDTLVQRNPKIIANQMDGEIVMMSIDNGEYYGLDETGSRIWELLESPVKINNIIETLISEFEVGQEECINDTFEFLNDLKEKNLLLIKDEPGS